MSITTTLRRSLRVLLEKSAILRRGASKFRQILSGHELVGRSVLSSEPWRLFNVELTNRCPFRCVMCARTNNMTRDQGLLTLDLFKKVVDEYAAANPKEAATEVVWLHHFGESLVHPEVGSFIRYAVSKGLKPALSINPLFLTPAMSQDLLESKVALLNISLDGQDDASFEKIRGLKNAYEPSKKNLLDFLKMKVEMGAKTQINLSMIDFSMNRESIEKLREYWSSIPGIDEFVAKGFRLWNGDAEDVNRLSKKRVNNAELRKTHPKVSCNIPWKKMTLTWDGDVVPCCYDYDKKYILGNAKTSEMTQIWNGEQMQKLRKEFLDNDVKNPLCRNCPELYLPAESEE